MASFLAKIRSPSGSSDFVPRFRGVSDEECQTFVRSIRQRAFSEDKIGDYQWMAAQASGHFADKAGKWYDGLEQSVKDDWLLLERALLSKYGRKAIESDSDESDEVDRRMSMSVFTPAAAPPTLARRSPPAAPAPLPVALQTARQAVSGRIKIIGYPSPYWLNVSRSKQGHYYATDKLAKAVTVKLIPDADVKEGSMIEVTEEGVADYLGIHWRKRHNKKNGWAKLVRLSPDPVFPTSQVSSSTTCEGTTRGDVWFLQGEDLCAKFPDGTGTLTALQVALNNDSQIFLARDWDSYRTNHPQDFKGRLVFEPVP